MIEYHAHMSLCTAYAIYCEIVGVDEIYSYHLMVDQNGKVIIQPKEPVEGRPILCFMCSGLITSSHFEPIIPQYDPPHQQPPFIANPILTAVNVISPASFVVQWSANNKTDNEFPVTDYHPLPKIQCLCYAWWWTKFSPDSENSPTIQWKERKKVPHNSQTDKNKKTYGVCKNILKNPWYS